MGLRAELAFVAPATQNSWFTKHALMHHAARPSSTSERAAPAQPRMSAPLSRRTFTKALLLPFLLPLSRANAQQAPVEHYDPLMSRRRLVNVGPPPPDAKPPTFQKGTPTFSIDDGLEAQDLAQGKGDAIARGSLVSARWLLTLADGRTIDDTNIATPVLFRPGAHQVPPGIEDSVIGMRASGQRRIRGSAERILT